MTALTRIRPLLSPLVSERQCQVCGRTFVPGTGQHRFCTPVCRERARGRGTRSPARYGNLHKKLRQAVAVQVASGRVACVRCGGPIAPGEPWDLGHVDGGDGYAGPEHRACNRATAGRGTEPETYEDDPEQVIFWGPPYRVGDPPRRWSREGLVCSQLVETSEQETQPGSREHDCRHEF